MKERKKYLTWERTYNSNLHLDNTKILFSKRLHSLIQFLQQTLDTNIHHCLPMEEFSSYPKISYLREYIRLKLSPMISNVCIFFNKTNLPEVSSPTNTYYQHYVISLLISVLRYSNYLRNSLNQ